MYMNTRTHKHTYAKPHIDVMLNTYTNTRVYEYIKCAQKKPVTGQQAWHKDH